MTPRKLKVCNVFKVFRNSSSKGLKEEKKSNEIVWAPQLQQKSKMLGKKGSFRGVY